MADVTYLHKVLPALENIVQEFLQAELRCPVYVNATTNALWVRLDIKVPSLNFDKFQILQKPKVSEILDGGEELQSILTSIRGKN